MIVLKQKYTFTYEHTHFYTCSQRYTCTSSQHKLTCQVGMASSTIHYFYVRPFTEMASAYSRRDLLVHPGGGDARKNANTHTWTVKGCPR